MTFEWPIMLVLLLALPLLAGLYVWMQSRRRRYALKYASVSLVAQAVGQGPGVRRHIPAALYLLAIGALIIAMARPQATIPVPQNTGTILLVIDVSGSMFAQDVHPNRMEATKETARDFVQSQPSGVRIGVVSFSDFAALVAPPGADRSVVLDAIGRLRPQRGTNMGAGLQVALDAIYEEQSDGEPIVTTDPIPARPSDLLAPTATIILLSDGQSNTGPDPLVVAQEAVTAGIKVYTVGIGTPEGTVLRIQGRNVFTRLDEETLITIANETGARYFNAQDERDLRQVYEELERERVIEHEETEVTFIFAGAALVMSMLAGALGLMWFNRLP